MQPNECMPKLRIIWNCNWNKNENKNKSLKCEKKKQLTCNSRDDLPSSHAPSNRLLAYLELNPSIASLRFRREWLAAAAAFLTHRSFDIYDRRPYVDLIAATWLIYAFRHRFTHICSMRHKTLLHSIEIRSVHLKLTQYKQDKLTLAIDK